MTDEHAVGVSDPGNGWYRALCAACSWKGTATRTRQVAGFQAEAHRKYIDDDRARQEGG